MTPQFYTNPVPLHPDRHAGKGLAQLDFSFAREAKAVRISLAEIPIAALSYPVVFTSGDEPAPVAILGLADTGNLFVDPSGAWLKGAYVPAYVRRYPFILGDSGESFFLCIEDTETVVVEGGAPLFTDGAPSTLVDRAFAFARAHQAEDEATRPFAQALRSAGLLEPRTVTAQTPGDAPASLSGFLTVSETRFRELPDEVFQDWRRRGWLAAIYGQIQSTLNWSRLGDMRAQAG